MGNAVESGDASGTGRAEPPSETRVLLSPIHLRRPTRTQYFLFPSTFYSHTEYEDEEDWHTPSPDCSTDMDMYSSGGYGADINTSSEVDDDMDFYEADSSQPATMVDAQSTLNTSNPGNHMQTTQGANGSNTPSVNIPTAKVNTAKLHELRAKLLANRQATPVKDVSNPVSNVNAVSIKTESQSRPQSPALTPNTTLSKNKANIQTTQSKLNRPTAASILSQSNSVDALIAEGHATAAVEQSDVKNQNKTAPMKQLNTTESTIKPFSDSNLVENKSATSPAVSHNRTNTAEQFNSNTDKSSSTVKSPETPNEQQNTINSLTKQKPNIASPVPEQKSSEDKDADAIFNQRTKATKPVHPLSSGPLHKRNLSLAATKIPKEKEDEYFKDVDLWLTITGFHDAAFREQKLKTYKMRAVLEEKKRALELEFAELERQEAAAANDPSTKDYMRAVSAAYMPPPPPPASAPTDEQSAPLTKASPVSSQPASAGAKRPRSPSVPVNNNREKLSRLNTSGRAVRRDDLFDKPLSASASRRGSDQRSHYANDRSDRSDYHRRAGPDASPTHQSISVRGQAFRPNDSSFGRRESWGAPRSPEQWSTRPHGWNSTSFSDVNEQPIGQGGYSSNKYTQAAADERFFIIKSWNMQNVIDAQRDGVWATQEKNTRLFTDAFHTCRSVLLLFSVNKSMAFQGAAVMTSPPSPTVPQPLFCKKLKWPCSPPFRIRWLCTTPVHFKFVGHLRNTLNPGDDGQPHAVLVGKDGQEVNTSTGQGVVEILRQADLEAKGEDDRP
ncbi:hypothetical protein E4T50_07196 [Aureobasidium sp. EXF-12298]|nr:hypothetical protein E4T50_07196 [Aureobasidium sp. EXF-12298]